ncbi:hypothetical protein E2C01_055202 [Portunus trituberculatus]|uniref:Uncharacterized protein n=1 Tax=Portunus trituberculatus TaxID=210409 RepID=A0A5B7GVZ8_PORTR|nr:hypothetical protein [Portunus trituberculatus]
MVLKKGRASGGRLCPTHTWTRPKVLQGVNYRNQCERGCGRVRGGGAPRRKGGKGGGREGRKEEKPRKL